MIDTVSSGRAAAVPWRGRGEPAYPAHAPFDPSEAFPEFPRLALAKEPNPVFSMVREALHALSLDEGRFGTDAWNPLGGFAAPGATILVKPNWVLHRNEGGGGMEEMVTHPSVIRAVLEYVFLARPKRVVLGDAPLQGCDFAALMATEGLDEVVETFRARGLPLEVVDFRRTVSEERLTGAGKERRVSEGARGLEHYVEPDLGAASFLEPVSAGADAFRVTMYDPAKLPTHHAPGRHRYLMAREAFEADLVVNLPKLKAHKKAGLTCCLKNLIGLNGMKEYLPHHRCGAKGDSHPVRSPLADALEKALDAINRHRAWPKAYAFAERVIYALERRRQRRLARRAADRVLAAADEAAELEGNWWGNDTIWRTCLDLNRALLYADRDGVLRDAPQRRELSIVDAVVAGQGDGPLAPEALATGAILAAVNPVAGDWMAARVFGWEPEKIPLLAHFREAAKWPLFTGVMPESPAWNRFPAARPPRGWLGKVERDREKER